MSRITFNNPSGQSSFADLFSDSGEATWYQLWTGVTEDDGSFVDTSAFNSAEESTFNSARQGWIRESDLQYLKVDFTQADDTILYVRPWDGSSTEEAWESSEMDFSNAYSNMITSVISSDTSLDEMFTDHNKAHNLWYRLWIGNAEGTSGRWVDTNAINQYGNGWILPENLSDVEFSLDDAGKDLWIKTWVKETGINRWHHWTVRKDIFIDNVSVSEIDGTATFTVSLPVLVPAGETLNLNYATVSGTASQDEDYTTATGEITFQAGESEQQVTISILDDSVAGEESESFNLVITNTSNENYVSQVEGTCIIADNDETSNQGNSIITPQGNEFKINSTTSNNQENIDAVYLSNDSFIAVWESESQDSLTKDVCGQLYDTDSNPAGTEFVINTYTTNHQSFPSVASLSGGGFVIVWQSLGQDGSGYGIFGQRYDSDGDMAGVEFQINTQSGFNQAAPSVATLYGGSFIVTWHSAGQDGSGSGIYGQLYDSDGVAQDDEFKINTTTEGNQNFSFVESLTGGGFVVVWDSESQDGSGSELYGQIYDSAGQASGNELTINTFTENDQKSCSAAGLADGGFVVVWASDDQDGDGYGVYGQRYDAAGVAVGTEFIVNSYTVANQESPDVISLADGGFIVSWESYGQDGSLEGIYAQLYNGSATAIGNEIRLNSVTENNQNDPVVASIFNLGFVALWESPDEQDQASTGVYGRLFSVDTAEIAVNAMHAPSLGLMGVSQTLSFLHVPDII